MNLSIARHFYKILFFFTRLTNSLLLFVCANMLSTFSTASSERIPLKALRILSTAACSSSSRSRSSRLVPDFTISIAGKILFSESYLSSTSSIFPVPLNSSNTTSSILLPVSTRAVASIVRLPPFLILRAAPKNLFGI